MSLDGIEGDGKGLGLTKEGKYKQDNSMLRCDLEEFGKTYAILLSVQTQKVVKLIFILLTLQVQSTLPNEYAD
jgi:hypothetical protein